MNPSKFHFYFHFYPFSETTFKFKKMELVREKNDINPIDYRNRETKEVLYNAFTGYDSHAHQKLL